MSVFWKKEVHIIETYRSLGLSAVQGDPDTLWHPPPQIYSQSSDSEREVDMEMTGGPEQRTNLCKPFSFRSSLYKPMALLFMQHAVSCNDILFLASSHGRYCTTIWINLCFQVGWIRHTFTEGLVQWRAELSWHTFTCVTVGVSFVMVVPVMFSQLPQLQWPAQFISLRPRGIALSLQGSPFQSSGVVKPAVPWQALAWD